MKKSTLLPAEWQTVQTLILCLVLQHLIWVYTVCSGLSKYLGLLPYSHFCLGQFSPLSSHPILVHILFASNWQLSILNQQKGRMTVEMISWSISTRVIWQAGIWMCNPWICSLAPEVIKLFSWPIQLTMKFHLVIKIKIPTIKTSFMLNSAEHAAQLSWSRKKF